MLKVGDTLTLEPMEGEGEQYKSKVEEIGESYIHIDYPVHTKTGKTVFLLNGMQFKASFIGDDNGLYLFETEVIGKVRQPIPMVVLSYPGTDKLVRVQRRRYVRVEANADVAIHPLQQEFTPFTTMTTDISAGGAAIVLPQQQQTQLVPGMVVETWLALAMRSGEYHYLKLKAKIVRIFQAENSDVYKASLQFFDVSPQDRVLLIRYSFERQLEMRKKEEKYRE
ncbi:c-di-GMP-binding flagellar brake protein YcgR, contains PilZNR and PilZ domains [Parageobacillus thermantarcticus]|uniref:C-di-GMP-binding flagellar brake protein YcgR, contains PilZNR and PilZ domains n=1 Tax=Parageobacillus thermantarcticus TaxID=186116 RepID=A0A1I0T3N4_9BACL|nr:flagellar brake domain-containing protein [Parageobacillus thermantarcticus]SFA46307.1 c-di-GMP-binding flagellar brake protein YcgR, contains PilZNR and PilZ domains [Parageobacillus thermantarcticus]